MYEPWQALKSLPLNRERLKRWGAVALTGGPGLLTAGAILNWAEAGETNTLTRTVGTAGAVVTCAASISICTGVATACIAALIRQQTPRSVNLAMATGVPTAAVITFASVNSVGLLELAMMIVAGTAAMAANLNCLDKPANNPDNKRTDQPGGDAARDE